MAHPIMFDDVDPMLLRVRHLALGFPGGSEKVSHGRPAFFTKKVFAYYGCSVRSDGEWIEHGQSIVVGVAADERVALLGDPRFFLPAYLGAWGWIAVDLGSDTDWGEVAELLDASFRLTAPAKLIAELNRRA